jgi:AhpD family alkylhydroperoxidase
MVPAKVSFEEFKEEREKLQEKMQSYSDKNMKRFLSLDSSVYRKGELTGKTKELLGLVASTVLRCDDCINYHLGTCFNEGVTDRELVEALDIALVVGGSITIPHIRRALDVWDGLKR